MALAPIAPAGRGRRRNQAIQIIAVEPAESAVLSGAPAGAHKIDGVGAGFVVPLWRDDVAEEIEPVSTADAVAMAVRLAREEGLFAGTSGPGPRAEVPANSVRRSRTGCPCVDQASCGVRVTRPGEIDRGRCGQVPPPAGDAERAISRLLAWHHGSESGFEAIAEDIRRPA